MPVPLGPQIPVFYLPTKVSATAREVLAPGTYKTSFEGSVPVEAGDWIVTDNRDGGRARSAWPAARMAKDFRRLDR